MPQTLSIIDRIEQKIAESDVTLAPFDDVAIQIQQKAASEDFDVKEIEQLILSDQALAAEVLRAANSPFYGGLSKIQTVKSAVVRLGVREVANVVLLTTEREKYELRSAPLAQLAEPLWRHAVGVAIGAQWLAKRLGYGEVAKEAFIGGLIHDVGKLLLLCILDDLLEQGDAPPIGEAVLHELLSSKHAEEGHRLAQQWNLPDEYARVIRDHESEQVRGDDSLLLLVRLANEACHKLGIGLERDASIDLASTEEAQQLCAGEITLAELEITLEDSSQLTI
jgi:HD-like signal output (HDOD) protein